MAHMQKFKLVLQKQPLDQHTNIPTGRPIFQHTQVLNMLILSLEFQQKPKESPGHSQSFERNFD